MKRIYWESCAKNLGISNGDEEGIVHELAHAFDCIGTKAFRYVGSQDEVEKLIKNKYGKINCIEANKSEIRVSAITWNVFKNLDYHMDVVNTEANRMDVINMEISNNLWSNMIGSWDEGSSSSSLDKLEFTYNTFKNNLIVRASARIITGFLAAKFMIIDNTIILNVIKS